MILKMEFFRGIFGIKSTNQLVDDAIKKCEQKGLDNTRFEADVNDAFSKEGKLFADKFNKLADNEHIDMDVSVFVSVMQGLQSKAIKQDRGYHTNYTLIHYKHPFIDTIYYVLVNKEDGWGQGSRVFVIKNTDSYKSSQSYANLK